MPASEFHILSQEIVVPNVSRFGTIVGLFPSIAVDFTGYTQIRTVIGILAPVAGMALTVEYSLDGATAWTALSTGTVPASKFVNGVGAYGAIPTAARTAVFVRANLFAQGLDYQNFNVMFVKLHVK